MCGATGGRGNALLEGLASLLAVATPDPSAAETNFTFGFLLELLGEDRCPTFGHGRIIVIEKVRKRLWCFVFGLEEHE